MLLIALLYRWLNREMGMRCKLHLSSPIVWPATVCFLWQNYSIQDIRNPFMLRGGWVVVFGAFDAECRWFESHSSRFRDPGQILHS